MINLEWVASYCEFDYKPEPDTILVTNIHWILNGEDDVTGEWGRVIGTTDVTSQGHVYIDQPTVEQVSGADMIGWVHTEEGPAWVTDQENLVKDQIDEKNNPTEGGFQPQL